jgi:mannose-6-phosphate isomerase
LWIRIIKPEVAVVLSERFLGFVGFRPVEEIQQFARDVAELRAAIGEESARRFVDLEAQEAGKKLKETFGKIFDDEERKASGLVDSFMRRVKKDGNNAFGKERTRKEIYLAEVATNIPATSAFLFFANLVVLERGEGIAIQPNVIHAYVEGDVIEVFVPCTNISE